jgi:hypothetical protein
MNNMIYKPLEGMIDSLGLKTKDVLFIMGCTLIILCLIVIIMTIRQALLMKKYKRFMMGSDGRSLEEELRSRIEYMQTLDNRIEKIEDQNSVLTKRLNESFQKMGIVKYDAFKEMGGKLSFALALLSDKNTGFVINVMHSREGCYNYVKEIVDGKSSVALAEEERQALDEAILSGLDK